MTGAEKAFSGQRQGAEGVKRMWAEESVLYQIYPLGMCGAPFENPASPGTPVSEEDNTDGHGAILQVIGWIPHLKKLNVNVVLFNPLFESDTHGYNTRDFFRVDRRLGTNGDIRYQLWWPQERPFPMRVAWGPRGIPLPSMPGPKTLCGVGAGT